MRAILAIPRQVRPLTSAPGEEALSRRDLNSQGSRQGRVMAHLRALQSLFTAGFKLEDLAGSVGIRTTIPSRM
jgi:hypothetical protein